MARTALFPLCCHTKPTPRRASLQKRGEEGNQRLLSIRDWCHLTESLPCPFTRSKLLFFADPSYKLQYLLRRRRCRHHGTPALFGRLRVRRYVGGKAAAFRSSSSRAVIAHCTSFFLSQHKNLLKFSKGYRGRSKNCFRIAIRRVEKAWQYGFRDRRRKKREWRKLWIQRIQAGVRQYQFSYSTFIPALVRSDIQLNRKVLAEMAANEPFAFKSVVDTVRAVQG
jgi:large subunit ribosomal protein L20